MGDDILKDSKNIANYLIMLWVRFSNRYAHVRILNLIR